MLRICHKTAILSAPQTNKTRNLNPHELHNKEHQHFPTFRNQSVQRDMSGTVHTSFYRPMYCFSFLPSTPISNPRQDSLQNKKTTAKQQMNKQTKTLTAALASCFLFANFSACSSRFFSSSLKCKQNVTVGVCVYGVEVGGAWGRMGMGGGEGRGGAPLNWQHFTHM